MNNVFAQTHNNRLQRTVRKRPAAEPERYAARGMADRSTRKLAEWRLPESR